MVIKVNVQLYICFLYCKNKGNSQTINCSKNLYSLSFYNPDCQKKNLKPSVFMKCFKFVILKKKRELQLKRNLQYIDSDFASYAF